MDYRIRSVIVIASACLLAPALGACADDGSAEDTAAASSGETTATSSGTTMAATDTEPGATSVATMGASSGGTSSMDTTAGATESADGATESATEGATEGDTEAGVCEGLEGKACANNEACMPIVGRPILAMGDGPCLGEREFIECQPAMGCGDAITYACEGDDATMYEFIDTCIPSTWVECGPPPPVDIPPCM